MRGIAVHGEATGAALGFSRLCHTVPVVLAFEGHGFDGWGRALARLPTSC